MYKRNESKELLGWIKTNSKDRDNTQHRSIIDIAGISLRPANGQWNIANSIPKTSICWVNCCTCPLHYCTCHNIFKWFLWSIKVLNTWLADVRYPLSYFGLIVVMALQMRLDDLSDFFPNSFFLESKLFRVRNIINLLCFGFFLLSSFGRLWVLILACFLLLRGSMNSFRCCGPRHFSSPEGGEKYARSGNTK